MDARTTFAMWRINAPYKPITRKGLGQRMGGGKGAIDHYVTPVRYGRLIVEVGGKVELGEVEHILTEVAKKLPFPAKVRSQIRHALVGEKVWTVFRWCDLIRSDHSFYPLVLCGNSILMSLFQVMSKESLAALHKKPADMEQNNQNPWSFKKIAQGNMLGIRRVLSPFDLHNHGRFTGKFHFPQRVWHTWGTEI